MTKPVIFVIYIVLGISFASLVDASEKPCGNRYAFITYLGIGLGWPIFLPIVGIVSALDKDGLKCRDHR